MPRPARRGRERRSKRPSLAVLTDGQLAEVWILGELVDSHGQPTFTPTSAERREAGTILRRRGRIGLPPDPRPVLDGGQPARDEVRAAMERYRAERHALLDGRRKGGR